MNRTEQGNTFAWITTHTSTNFCKVLHYIQIIIMQYYLIWRSILSSFFATLSYNISLYDVFPSDTLYTMYFQVNLSAADLLSTLWCPLHRWVSRRHGKCRLLKYDANEDNDHGIKTMIFVFLVCLLSWLRSIYCQRSFARSQHSTPLSALLHR